MKKVGTAEIVKGEKTKGFIQVGTDTDGSPFQIPVLVAAGQEDGPTFWVHGCIHGEEYGGAASIIRYFQELDTSSLKGTFVGVPVVNLPSFKDRNRISPLDGANLNRIFPGNPNGTYSQRLAHELIKVIGETADVVIDFHSGGIGAEVPYYVIINDDKTETAVQSMDLAKKMGADFIWKSEGEAGTGGTITASVMDLNIPTVTVECGGGNVTEEHVELFKNSIKYAMQAYQMIPGEAPILDEYTIVGNASFFFTKEGGMFVPACKVGDILNKGDKIGSIMNLFGKVVEELYCPEDNSYIAALGHRFWPTEPGQLISESMPIESRGK